MISMTMGSAQNYMVLGNISTENAAFVLTTYSELLTKQDGQCMFDVTIRRVHITVVAMESNKY
jgi:hypothetical protein